MSEGRIISKNLGGVEDLVFGETVIQQTRNLGTYDITEIRGFWPTNNMTELSELDTTQHPKAMLVDGTTCQLYQHNGSIYVHISVVNPEGTTANRPTTDKINTQYFDSTLGIPIWWNGTAWINALGTLV